MVATTSQPPEWLVPGASVVVYKIGGRPGNGEYARRDTVKTVGKVWFTLTDERDNTRYRVRDQEIRTGSGWEVASLRVVPLDSDEARTALARRAQHRRNLRGVLAVEAWQKDPSAEHLTAAIDALIAIRNAPPIPESPQSWLD